MNSIIPYFFLEIERLWTTKMKILRQECTKVQFRRINGGAGQRHPQNCPAGGWHPIHQAEGENPGSTEFVDQWKGRQTDDRFWGQDPKSRSPGNAEVGARRGSGESWVSLPTVFSAAAYGQRQEQLGADRIHCKHGGQPEAVGQASRPLHTGSFHKYHDDGLQQAVFIKKVVNFWPKQLN